MGIGAILAPLIGGVSAAVVPLAIEGIAKDVAKKNAAKAAAKQAAAAKLAAPAMPEMPETPEMPEMPALDAKEPAPQAFAKGGRIDGCAVKGKTRGRLL